MVLRVFKMIRWVKELIFIVKYYRQHKSALENELYRTNKVIRDRTDIHADINYKNDNQIVVIGRYGNHDYIQTYRVSDSDFTALIKQLKEMQKYGHIGRIDCAPRVRAVFDNQLRKKRKQK